MNKVICDVCGTDYPETEPRCPICDCVRTEGGQTSAGNTEDGGYTYVRGGRFSKANVRKRLKAKQMQEDESMYASADADDDSDDESFDEEELEAVSNRGLVIVMLILLAAIIAVGSFLVIEFFKKPADRDYTKSTTTTSTQEQEKPEDEKTPCTAVVAPETPFSITAAGQTVNLMDHIDVLPADTTDTLRFASADEAVATVGQDGIVTAVGAGQTVITIYCGEVEVEVEIICDFAPENPDTEEPDTEEPDTEEPDTEEPDTDEPVEVIKLKLRYSDVTLDGVYPTLQLYKGKIDVTEIKWTSSKENVATVKDGLVTAVSRGSTIITAEYQGQKVTCAVHVSQAALDKLGIGQEPVTPEQPEEPDKPQGNALKINGKDPKWNLGRPNTAEANLLLNGTKYENRCSVTVVDSDGKTVDITWSISDTSIVEYDAASGKFKAKALGSVTLKATYDGVEYEVRLHVV